MPCCKKPPAGDDEEFQTYVRLICSLMTTLRRPDDKEYVQDILEHCTKLSNSGKPDVRRYNNAFVSYFLKVLYTTASTQPLEIYDEWYKTNQASSRASTRVWLEENKSYFAMEKTPDGAVMFYSAVAEDPKAGWDKGGIKKKLQQYEEDFLKPDTKKKGGKKSDSKKSYSK